MGCTGALRRNSQLVHCLQRFFTFGDSVHDGISRGFPNNDSRVLVVTIQTVLDGSNQVREAVETAATIPLVGHLSKPALDQIQPRTRRWDEVDVESGMSSDPGFDSRVFVGFVIVHDKTQIEMGRISTSILLRKRMNS